MALFLSLPPTLRPYLQLVTYIESGGLDTEGLLRIPGATTRVKVGWAHLGIWLLVCLKNETATQCSEAALNHQQPPPHPQALCQELESSFYDGVFPWHQLKQHDAATLLKLFIRELPHPLLTVEYLNTFVAVNSTCRWNFCCLNRAPADNVNNAAPASCRAPHQEAAAACPQPAGPSVTPSQPGHHEGKLHTRLAKLVHSCSLFDF